LDAYHEDTRPEQECDDPCLLFEVKKGVREQSKFWETGLTGWEGAHGPAIAAGLSHWRPGFDPR